VPIWKGFGYSLTYDTTYTNSKYARVGDKAGWWSDNLQNRDHTLLAGQATSQDVSVNAPDLMTGLWVPLQNYTSTEPQVTSSMSLSLTFFAGSSRPALEPICVPIQPAPDVYSGKLELQL
jgi:hypothetical protein